MANIFLLNFYFNLKDYVEHFSIEYVKVIMLITRKSKHLGNSCDFFVSTVIYPVHSHRRNRDITALKSHRISRFVIRLRVVYHGATLKPHIIFLVNKLKGIIKIRSALLRYFNSFCI